MQPSAQVKEVCKPMAYRTYANLSGVTEMKNSFSFIMMMFVCFMFIACSDYARATGLFELQGAKQWINTSNFAFSFTEPIQKGMPVSLAVCNNQSDVMRNSTLQDPGATVQHDIISDIDNLTVLSYAEPARKSMKKPLPAEMTNYYQLVLSAQYLPVYNAQ